MNLKRRMLLKHTVRLVDSHSNSPPVLVTFEDQVGIKKENKYMNVSRWCN